MSDYTKDEWLYESGCVVSSKGAVLLHAERGELLTRAVERDANVRLASAAPDLKAAAYLALRFLSSLNGRVTKEVWDDAYDTVSALSAACAKARGES